tara:strand:+ start:478 stop:597 length:120 start_codon:yes stop_codon:yes gene_type:complete
METNIILYPLSQIPMFVSKEGGGIRRQYDRRFIKTKKRD